MTAPNSALVRLYLEKWRIEYEFCKKSREQKARNSLGILKWALTKWVVFKVTGHLASMNTYSSVAHRTETLVSKYKFVKIWCFLLSKPALRLLAASNFSAKDAALLEIETINTYAKKKFANSPVRSAIAVSYHSRKFSSNWSQIFDRFRRKISKNFLKLMITRI